MGDRAANKRIKPACWLKGGDDDDDDDDKLPRLRFVLVCASVYLLSITLHEMENRPPPVDRERRTALWVSINI